MRVYHADVHVGQNFGDVGEQATAVGGDDVEHIHIAFFNHVFFKQGNARRDMRIADAARSAARGGDGEIAPR